MAAGYALEAWLERAPGRRHARLLALGGALTAAFVVLRALNGYGDPRPWSAQPRVGFTLLSFLSCEKYPPSLEYLLMTLGPSLAALGLLARPGRQPRAPERLLEVYGSVPLFFYLLHLFVLHATARLVSAPRLADPVLRARLRETGVPGLGLPWVYLAWTLALVLLYPLCRWYRARKQRGTHPIYSYI
jgi:uncharacterized membrane protein